LRRRILYINVLNNLIKFSLIKLINVLISNTICTQSISKEYFGIYTYIILPDELKVNVYFCTLYIKSLNYKCLNK